MSVLIRKNMHLTLHERAKALIFLDQCIHAGVLERSLYVRPGSLNFLNMRTNDLILRDTNHLEH